MDLLALEDRRASVVFPDRRDRKEILDQWASPAPPVPRVCPASTVPRDNAERAVNEANLVSWVHLGDLAPPVLLDLQENRVHLVWLATLASRALLETQDALAFQVHLVSLVPLDPRVPRVRPVPRAVLVKLESLVLLDLQENVAFLVYLAHLAHLVSVDKPVLGESLVQKESVALKVPSAHLVSLVPPAPSARPATLAPLVQMASPDRPVSLDAQVTKDPPDPLDKLAALDRLAYPDLLARPDLLAQRENEETAEKPDLRAWRDLLALGASLAHLAFRARRETLVQQDRKEPRVTVVLLVSRVCLVHLVLLVTKVFLVLLVPLVPLVSLVPKVHLDAMEALVSRVLWVLPVPVVLLAKTDLQVPQVLLVLLVRLVLLVNPWVMTQSPWRPSSTGTRPRDLTRCREMTPKSRPASSARRSRTTSAAT